MTTTGLHPGLDQFRHLPAFAGFILKEHLQAFAQAQVDLFIRMKLPIMERLKHLGKEQLVEITRVSLTDYLGMISQSRVRELLEASLERWKKDQLEIIGKFELVAEDITSITYIRGKVFRQFLPLYTKDVNLLLELVDELDAFFSASVTSAMDTYIFILKEKLTRNEQDLLEAQRIAHMGNFEWDLVTNHSNNSPELQQIFNLDGGGLEGFLKYVHPEDRQTVETMLANAVTKGEFESEFRYCKGPDIKFIWSKGITQYEEGKPVKLIGTVQDITTRKQVEKQLIEKTDALERSNESLQQFAYVASHDLKEPLRKISTFTDIVLTNEENLSESSRAHLAKVYTSSTRMRQMIDDIMAYSTLTQWAGRELYPLDKIVHDTLELLEQQIQDKAAVIEAGNLPEALFVPAQFRQLFQNLIANSLKFSKPGVAPRISIHHAWLDNQEKVKKGLDPSTSYLELTFTDNGIGFDEQFASKIFDLYSRLHSRSEFEGSGLGLAIAKRIIDNHNGIITAHSRPGEGAKFIITIPQ